MKRVFFTFSLIDLALDKEEDELGRKISWQIKRKNTGMTDFGMRTLIETLIQLSFQFLECHDTALIRRNLITRLNRNILFVFVMTNSFIFFHLFLFVTFTKIDSRRQDVVFFAQLL